MFLDVSNVNVFYGDSQALFDVSFHVDEGDILSIIGSNAAGKSTILKTISGILRPESGGILFDGYNMERLPSHKIVEAGVVQVPEGRQLFPVMTVLENLEMGSVTPEAKKQRSQTTERVYQIFPILKDRAEQLAGTLSGGEQQMLAIARALMSLPKLLMFDEPSLGLAPMIVREIFGIIREINNQGTTVLLVEQNVHHALNMCDRAYVLENGHLILEGTGKDLLNNKDVKKAYLGI
ncbi:MAG: ABC transporter ATP-binding protein [Deltaproteobacteria bacterium]|nr:ABC transporter ATP-binding protein [Deltaproteobacteria bacterium]